MNKEAVLHLESALRISELLKSRAITKLNTDTQIVTKAIRMIERELELAIKNSYK